MSEVSGHVLGEELYGKTTRLNANASEQARGNL